jgi:hypothetical protein
MKTCRALAPKRPAAPAVSAFPRQPIRSDIRARFTAVVQRAIAKSDADDADHLARLRAKGAKERRAERHPGRGRGASIELGRRTS